MALEQRTEVEKDPHEGSWGSRARLVSKEYIPEGRRHVAKTASGGRILATIPQGGRDQRTSRDGTQPEIMVRPAVGLLPRCRQRPKRCLSSPSPTEGDTSGSVTSSEGGDQRLPTRPDRRPCRSLQESAGSGGPPTPSSCGIVAKMQPPDAVFATCRRPSGIHALLYCPSSLRVDPFLLPSAVPKPPLLLLEVKLVHTFQSKSWFKQGRKWESCSMNLGLGSKRKWGKVVISVTV